MIIALEHTSRSLRKGVSESLSNEWSEQRRLKVLSTIMTGRDEEIPHDDHDEPYQSLEYKKLPRI